MTDMVRVRGYRQRRSVEARLVLGASVDVWTCGEEVGRVRRAYAGGVGVGVGVSGRGRTKGMM
jgi:hypothetical protein